MTHGLQTRATVFAPRLEALLRDHRGADLFRLEPDTIGVAGPDLMNAVLLCRPAGAAERPTFKPVEGRHVERREASGLMQAVAADVKAALRKPLDEPDLSGDWPQVGHNYLRDLVFGKEIGRLRILVDRRLELTTYLTRAAVTIGARIPGKPDVPLSGLAKMVFETETYAERRHAMLLYRRVAAAVCFTVSALVTNAIWLGEPFDDDVPNKHILHESLRLLPVSWNILRFASPETTAVDPRINADDDVLLFPFLSHRDPRLWDAPDEWRPRRWDSLDADHHPGYLPFGHESERCWGRHMVLPLAERLLDIVRRDGWRVDPRQTRARVDLAGLMEAVDVRLIRGRRS